MTKRYGIRGPAACQDGHTALADAGEIHDEDDRSAGEATAILPDSRVRAPPPPSRGPSALFRTTSPDDPLHVTPRW